MAKQLDLPVGTSPARARALQALAKKGRVTSEKVRVVDTGQTRVKLYKNTDDAATVEGVDGSELKVWPEDERRYVRHAEAEASFTEFVKDRAGRHPSEFRISAAHSDDPEQYDPEDAELHASLRAAWLEEHPEFDPLMEEEA